MDMFPDVIRIESSGVCNFRCIHCPTGNKPNGRPILSMEKFNNILKQFREKNFIPRVVVLYHGGEPLLNKNLEFFISALKDMGVKKTVITTNGSLLTEDRAKRLIEAGLDEIKASFDGESPEESMRIRCNSDYYNEIRNVKKLISLKKEMNSDKPIIKIANVRISDEKTLDLMVKANKLEYDNLPDYLIQEFGEDINTIEGMSFPATLWPGMRDADSFDIREYENKEPDYCELIFETVSILSNGDVVACCQDLTGEQVFGNVFEDSIFDIWFSERYTKFRDDFRKKIYSKMCKDCWIVNPKFLLYKA